jgi:hypothetical protein
MANKYMKKCLTILAIKKIQIKMTLRFHSTSVKMVIVKKKNVGQDAGDKEPLSTVGRNVN